MLLNLAPDHLDRHGSFEAYRAAKLLLFARQADRRPSPSLPVGLGGRGTRGGCAAPRALRRARRRGRRAATGRPVLARRAAHAGRSSASAAPHNVENAMAAAAVTLARGVDPEAVRAGLRTSPASRTASRRSPTLAGVLYVDDSKATNVASAVVGLGSFDGGVHAILGGRGEGRGLRPAGRRRRGALPRRVPHRRGAPDRSAMRSRGRGVPLRDCDTLDRAVAGARAAAAAGRGRPALAGLCVL